MGFALHPCMYIHVGPREFLFCAYGEIDVYAMRAPDSASHVGNKGNLQVEC